MSTATASRKREDEREKNFKKSIAAQAGANGEYHAKDDPAVNALSTKLNAKSETTKASRVVLVAAETKVSPAMVAILHDRKIWLARMPKATAPKPRAIPANEVKFIRAKFAVRQLITATKAAEKKAAEVNPKLATSQDREDQLDKAAEERWKVKPARINELFEAIRFAIAHPHKIEAQELTDGFVIVKNAHVWKVCHPALDRQPIIATRLDEKDDYRDVTRRQDVRECLVALREAVEIKREAKKNGKPPVIAEGARIDKPNGKSFGNIGAVAAEVVKQTIAASEVEADKIAPEIIPATVTYRAWNMVNIGGEKPGTEKVVVGL